MYHFQKNIGDYRSATMHLSLLEHGIYNQMLDWYYLDETPLPLDNRTLFRRLSAKSEVEQQSVLDVLQEMFEETPSGWAHKRIEREIAQYKAKADQARSAGKLGGRPIKKVNGYLDNRDGFEKEPDAKPTANQEPITTNHKPITIKDNASVAPFGVCDVVWSDFLKIRRAKKSPMTNTALAGIQREADKAGVTLEDALKTCCERGWIGFKSDWLYLGQRAGQNPNTNKHAGAAAAIFDYEENTEVIDV